MSELYKSLILVVDDNMNNLGVLTDLLQQANYEVRRATDGRTALMLARNQPIELVLLDIRLPDIDGYQVCRQLKQQELGQDVPVILVSALNDVHNKVEGFEVGAVDYITKPYQQEEVLSRVQTHLELFHLRRSLMDLVDERTCELNAATQDLIQTNRSLHKSENLQALILNSLFEGVFSISKNGTCIFANSACIELFGFEGPEQIIGADLHRLMHPPNERIDAYSMESCPAHKHFFQDVALSNESASFFKTNSSDFSVEYSATPTYSEDGECRVVISFIDITERKKNEAKIHLLIHEDFLTRLPNRRAFQTRLDLAIEQWYRGGDLFSLFLLDLDFFKEINDTLGHSIGDALLVAVANRIQGLIRNSDMIARIGGDEFGIIQGGVHAALDAAVLATKISNAFKDPFEIEDNKLRIGVSMGILIPKETGLDKDQLMSQVDAALYKAKAYNKGQYAFFEDSLTREIQREMEIVQQLSLALERDELYVEYQPQVYPDSGEIAGCEALVRWNHPDKGKLLPGQFLPVAEKRGLIKSISDWVLAAACKQAANWDRQGYNFGRVAINLCAAQVNSGDLTERIRDLIKTTGVRPEQLELEFTETVLINTSKETQDQLQFLSELGIRFAIDDFGTGFSSMKYLKQFHTDKLKIDREFVAGIPNNNSDVEIVKATIGLAKSLKLITTAEGVETSEQVAFMIECGCDEIQGFYFSKPISPQQLQQRYLLPSKQFRQQHEFIG